MTSVPVLPMEATPTEVSEPFASDAYAKVGRWGRRAEAAKELLWNRGRQCVFHRDFQELGVIIMQKQN